MLLLRDSPLGPEVLMTRRSAGANFAAGAYVFPGGALDRADAQAHPLAVCRSGQCGHVLTQAIGAIRETFEELGILLAYREEGVLADGLDVDALERVPGEGRSFASQCATRGLRLAADRLHHFARWIADPNNPTRFDTAFFVARMPAGQVPVADDTEQHEPQWVRPADALRRHHAGAFMMVFPTVRTLERLSRHASVESILAACTGEEPLTHNATRTGLRNGVLTRFTREDEPYGELALVAPEGQVVHCLDWQHEAPVPLMRNVQRLTAAGPGTNSYVVGDASTGYAVIDPGASERVHLARLHLAAHGNVRFIVCTDGCQEAAAAALQTLCKTEPLIVRTPAPGERVSLSGLDTTHTLVLLAVPGEADGRFCALLEEDRVLFGGGADPSSLEDLCRTHGVGFTLPAQGYVRLGSHDSTCTAHDGHEGFTK